VVAEMTSSLGGGGGGGGSDAFYFSFARAIVESGSDWLSAATLVVERPGRAVVGPRAERFAPKSSVPDLFRVRVSDVGRADWYARLLRSAERRKTAGRCGQESWRTRDGEVVNGSGTMGPGDDRNGKGRGRTGPRNKYWGKT